MIRAYHFTGPKMRDGRDVPADGVWLEESGSLAMCHKGLHASKHPYDALNYAPGFTLCLVDLDGEILEQGDKCCASKRLIISRFNSKPLCLQFVRDVASDVLHLWDAPQAVKDFLATGENPNAAAYAAYGAAYAAHAAANAANAAYGAAYAAHAAAYAAYTAYGAAYAAHAAAHAAANAKDKYRGWFLERVEAQFKEWL